MRALLPLALLALAAGCGPSSEDIAKNLVSPNVVVREDTAKIARNFGSEEVEQALIGALNDPSEKVRLNAVESLIELETVAAVPALIALLEKETDPEVQIATIDALGRLKDPQAVVPLILHIDKCRQDPSRTIPLNAIWALGFIGDGAALQSLTELRESEDTFIAWNATLALRNLRP